MKIHKTWQKYYVLTYLTEILSKKTWEEKKQYGQKIWKKIDLGLYKKSLRYIKTKIFTPENVTDKRYIFLQTNGGALTKSNIFVYNITPNDRKLIDLINATKKFSIPKSREKSLLMIGKALEGKKLVNISNVFNSLEMSQNLQNLPQDEEELEKRVASRLEKLAKLKEDPVKNAKAIAGIEKRIEQERKGDNVSNIRDLFNNYFTELNERRKGKYVIVLTYDTRAVASMSTGNDWRSCMNLDNGEFNHFVPSTISGGSFVAYLATYKDKKELSNPVSRVLCKTYYSNDVNRQNPDVIWKVSRHYGEDISGSRQWFPKAVENFLNANNKPKYNIYRIAPFHYNDGDAVFAYIDSEGVTDTISTAIKFPKMKKSLNGQYIFDVLNDLTRVDRVKIINAAIDDVTEDIYSEANDELYDNDTIDYEIKSIIEKDLPSEKKDQLLNWLEIILDNNYRILGDSYQVKHIATAMRQFLKIKDFDMDTQTLDDEPTSAARLYSYINKKFDRSNIDKHDFEKLVLEYQKIEEDDFLELLSALEENTRRFERVGEDELDEITDNMFNNLRNLRQGNISDRTWEKFLQSLEEAYDEFF